MLLSILIATYNAESFIRDQIDSILNQDSNEELELIICDDGSSDGTLQILRNYAELHSNIRIVKNPTNLGYAANFLGGLKEAKGDYIFFCDQDDIWFPYKISTILLAFAQEPSAQLIISRDLEFTALKPPSIPRKSNGTLKRLSFRKVARECSFKGANMAMTADLATKVCDLGTIKPIAHDWLVSLVAADAGSAYLLDYPLMFYRRHATSASMIDLVTNNPRSFRHRFLQKQIYHYQWALDQVGLLSSRNRKTLVEHHHSWTIRKGLLDGKHPNKEYGGSRFLFLHVLVEAILTRITFRAMFGDLYAIYLSRAKSTVNT